MKFSELKVGDIFRISENESTLRKSEEEDGYNSFDNIMVYNINDDQEVTKINSYRVAGEYTCVFEVEVYAESLDDAIDIIENDDGTYVKIQGDYLDNSFSVNHEVTESLNKDADYQKNCSDKSYFLEPDFE